MKAEYARDLLVNREKIFNDILENRNLNSQMRYFAVMGLIFSAIYGLCLGCYAGSWQIIVVAFKVPLLLFGTLAICLPSLFTFNVLLGSKLSFRQTLAVLLVASYLLCIVLVSLAPILLFFIVSTTNKPFVALLNVAIFVISGSFFISLLWQTMRYLSDKAGYQAKTLIIKIWSIIYMFVGTQMAWLLRPFFGEKGAFALFREIEGNFYIAVFKNFLELFN